MQTYIIVAIVAVALALTISACNNHNPCEDKIEAVKSGHESRIYKMRIQHMRDEGSLQKKFQEKLRGSQAREMVGDSVALPADRLERTIRGMELGDVGYAVPWAMYRGGRGLYLNGRYSIHSSPGGTVQMMIWKEGDGYHVDITSVDADFKWHKGANYVGGSDEIEVKGLTAK